MTGAQRRIVIVGASLAGLRGAEAMRRFSFKGEIVIIGEERHAPYDRPPLSKELLTQNGLPDDVGFRTPEDYTETDWDTALSRVGG